MYIYVYITYLCILDSNKEDACHCYPPLLTIFCLPLCAGAHDALTVLISHKQDFLAADRAGATALHMSAEGGHLQCVTLLLQHQAGVNTLDRQQYTPLFCACQMGHKEVVEALLLRKLAAQFLSYHVYNVVRIVICIKQFLLVLSRWSCCRFRRQRRKDTVTLGGCWRENRHLRYAVGPWLAPC